MVDIIVAQVLHMGKETAECGEVCWVSIEGATLGEDEGGLAGDGALQDDSTATLILIQH